MDADADTSVGVPDVRSVPLSSQTHASTSISVQEYGPALTKRVAKAIAPTRTVASRYSRDGDWIVVTSPTFRLATETLHPAVLNIGSIEDLWGKCNLTFSVRDFAAAAQPISASPGLLSSTDALLGISPVVESRLATMFAEARHAWFEDGVESEFSRAFSTLIHTYGDTAVSAVETLLSSPSINTEVAIEAEHELGELDHPPSLRYRRSLLERLLVTARSVRLRHGAAAGLASMDDPASLAAVSAAYAHEANQRLRQYLQLVVEQLERTRACRSS
jgi:hypothetical protein